MVIVDGCVTIAVAGGSGCVVVGVVVVTQGVVGPEHYILLSR